MQIQFDPGALEPLGGIGTVYPSLRVSDVWGVLTVLGGALVDSDWTWVAVPVSEDWTGSLDDVEAGWSLDTDSSWTVKRRGVSPSVWELARVP